MGRTHLGEINGRVSPMEGSHTGAGEGAAETLCDGAEHSQQPTTAIWRVSRGIIPQNSGDTFSSRHERMNSNLKYNFFFLYLTFWKLCRDELKISPSSFFHLLLTHFLCSFPGSLSTQVVCRRVLVVFPFIYLGRIAKCVLKLLFLLLKSSP